MGTFSRSGEFTGHKGQWHGAFMFSLISAWPNGWVNIEVPVIWDAIAVMWWTNSNLFHWHCHLGLALPLSLPWFSLEIVVNLQQCFGMASEWLATQQPIGIHARIWKQPLLRFSVTSTPDLRELKNRNQLYSILIALQIYSYRVKPFRQSCSTMVPCIKIHNIH